MSDLFVEHCYFSFQDEIRFFSKTTMEYWNIGIQKAFVDAIGGLVTFFSLASYYLHDRSLLMSWHNITFTFLTYLSPWAPYARCLAAADDTFTDFSDNDGRCCRSVTQTSALLRGNEWTSLWTFATGTCRIWALWLADIWILRCVNLRVLHVSRDVIA